MTEIAFVIDKFLSEKDNALCIRLELAENKGPYLELKGSSKPLSKQALTALSKENDKDAVTFLIQEEATYQKSQGNFSKDPLHSILRVAYSRSIQALKLLAATGKLYFNGKQLAADFFSKNELTLRLEPAAEGKIAITASVSYSGKELDIRDCDYLCPGPPVWFIKGIFIKMISTDLFLEISKTFKE